MWCGFIELTLGGTEIRPTIRESRSHAIGLGTISRVGDTKPMTPSLQPYPTYKPSDVEWLGDVPAHWEVRRLKSICRFAYGETLTSDMRQSGTVPVFGSNGRVGSHSSANTNSPCIVIGRKGSFGKVNFVSQPVFAIDTTYFVDERYSRSNLRWLSYTLGWVRLDAVTNDSAIPGLGRDDAYFRLLPLPPLPEQTAIAEYLDHADDRIRRYVSAKERLIALLEEERQAVIHRAVTRGLDPNVRLKPSGVEWLGDVPAHWEVAQLGRMGKFSKGVGGTKEDEVPEGIPCIRYGDLYTSHKFFIQDSRTFITEERALEYAPIEYGDVLFAASGETIERSR